MTMYEKIQLLCRNNGFEISNLGEKLPDINISKGSISKWKNGAIPRASTLKAIADYFGVDISIFLAEKQQVEKADNDLSRFDNIFPIEKRRIPMLGEIACGKPIFCDEDRESYVDVGTDIKADFCLRCKGDSMIGARIHDGDIVFVRRQSIVNNGEIAVVVIDNEATLKRVFYYPDKGKLVLQAENPKYEPFVFVGEELKDINILGKAIAFQSDVI